MINNLWPIFNRNSKLLVSRTIAFYVIAFFVASAQAESFKYSCINTYLQEKGNYGPRFFLDASPLEWARGNPEPPPSLLKIFGQNFENLGTFKDVFREKIMVNKVLTNVKTVKTIEKSENQKIRLALRIKKHNPDIIIGTEVKDIETAAEYSKTYLNDEYQAILVEGNDGRGIDVCFFIRRTLQFDLEVQSYKTYPSKLKGDSSPIFSRDFPVLFLRPTGASKSSQPLMAIFATHLKSRLADKDGIDNSLAKRSEQVLSSLEIMNDLQTQYPGIPILMGGDFNNDMHSSPEFKPFYSAGFTDTMDIAPNSPAKDQRYTQYFFTDLDKNKPGWELIASQLDAMLVNPVMSNFIMSSFIQRDIRPDGTESPMPRDSKSVNSRGSDHDGIVTLVDIAKLRANQVKP